MPANTKTKLKAAKAEMLTCEQCGKSFRRPNAAGPRPRYDTAACRQAAYMSRSMTRVGDDVFVVVADGKVTSVHRAAPAKNGMKGTITKRKLQA